MSSGRPGYCVATASDDRRVRNRVAMKTSSFPNAGAGDLRYGDEAHAYHRGNERNTGVNVRPTFSVDDDLANHFGRFEELEECYREMMRLSNWISYACVRAAGTDKMGKKFTEGALPATDALSGYLQSFGAAMGLTSGTGRKVSNGFDVAEDDAADDSRRL